MRERIVNFNTFQQVLRELGEMGILATKTVGPDRRIRDAHLYRPYVMGWATFAPWYDDALVKELQEIYARHNVKALVDGDRAWNLITAFQHTSHLEGEVWETGVYQGGSALMLRRLIERSSSGPEPLATMLRLFDSFEGLPETAGSLDVHAAGDFADNSLQAVRQFVGQADWIDFRKGWIPATFHGLEANKIRLAHVDVDLYQSVADCCEFIFPRLVPGGIMLFDDYGLASCPGARQAVDEYFRERNESPFLFPNGQCMVVRHAYRQT